MCGIAGFLKHPASGRSPTLQAQAIRMTRQLLHRGPDDSGVWFDEQQGIALAHVRLSILDLSAAGHQPMLSAGSRHVIVFNGEIYNHLELRAELATMGMKFRGHSDTEVLLAGIEQWGLAQTLRRCVGMFAFAIWDKHNHMLTLARDRVGEKPLYYGWCGNDFVFASELKALRELPQWSGQINRVAVAWFVRYGYVPSPLSIYEGIYKLEPGSHLSIGRTEVDRGLRVKPIVYWSVTEAAESGAANPWEGTDDEAIEQLDSLIRKAVALEMLADVPVGAFLSGGVDSSTVAAAMQAQSSRPIKTFTIGFAEDRYNEAHYARQVAAHLGSSHTELYVTSADAMAVIPRLPSIYDEPFADSSQIPTYLISALARKAVRVCLSGDGGDELFGGYSRYAQAAALKRRIHGIPAPLRRSAAFGLHRLSSERWDTALRLLPRRMRRSVTGEKLHRLACLLRQPSEEAIYANYATHHASGVDSFVLGGVVPLAYPHAINRLSGRSDFTTFMGAVDLCSYMPDNNLVKMDRASMAVSLEARVPLLDHRIVEFALRLPEAMKVRKGEGKWILRQVLYRYVPPALVNRPKMGFGVPIDSWLRGPLREWAESLLSESRLREDGFFNPKAVRRLWEEHVANMRDNHFYLWPFLMFQAWLAEQPK